MGVWQNQIWSPHWVSRLYGKVWGLNLFAAIFSVMLFNYDGFIWWGAIILGWISSIENWLLTLTLSTWTTDVKSIFHVWRTIKE